MLLYSARFKGSDTVSKLFFLEKFGLGAEIANLFFSVLCNRAFGPEDFVSGL